MLALPILGLIILGSVIWGMSAPNSTPNNWLPSHHAEQPAPPASPAK